MASININRAKYRSTKATATWLDKFFETQVKDSVEVTKTIGEKEVKTKQFQIVAHKLFALAEANGSKLEGIRAQVEADQTGAIGRARMILAGILKRKIVKGEQLKDAEGNDVVADEAFVAYKASISPAPAAPAADAA